jgi:hypothetical protein
MGIHLTRDSLASVSMPRPFTGPFSPVEDRNRYLAQLHHNQRGLPKCRYQVTVLHSCDCRASDGTIHALRFCRREFPDLFETVLSTVEDLPRPRQRHQACAIRD